VRSCCSREGLPLERQAAGATAIELDHATDCAERFEISLAVESDEHASMIGDGGDGGTNASAEWFAPGVTPQVVVATRAGWLGHDLQLASIAWGAETRSSCRGGEFVFVDEAAE